MTFDKQQPTNLGQNKQACNRRQQLYAPIGANCRTRQNIPVVFDSGPFVPLCEDMTSSTKSEVHNLLQCRERSTEPRPQVSYIIKTKTDALKQQISKFFCKFNSQKLLPSHSIQSVVCHKCKLSSVLRICG